MNEDWKQSELKKAGVSPFERSENGLTPAGRPGEGESPWPPLDPGEPSILPPGPPLVAPLDEPVYAAECADDSPLDALDEGAETAPWDDEEQALDEDADGPSAGDIGLPGQLYDGALDFAEDPPRHWTQQQRKKPKSLAKPELPRGPLTPQQKLLLLDTWQRSGLPARDFAALVHISHHTLYSWKKKFEELGPAGLMDAPRGGRQGSRLPELTKRTILMLKEAHPDWGCQRISDMLARGPALPASPAAVARVLHEAGYQMEEQPTRRHPDKVRSFERAKPNQLWQTDLFTFMLKRQNRRLYLVAYMDDHSRFITGYGLHASQSAALVIEVLRAGLAAYGVPAEILTDNGAQYVTWRGKSQFSRELEKRGIRQIVAKPRRPQTLGKIERFWGTLWRECIESSVFLDLEDARQRIGLFIDYYNLQRPHQGIDGLVPADRFFHAAPEVLKTLKQRVAENALELARHGVPKKPFYLTGQLDGKPFSVHREGDRVILRQAGEPREEIELLQPPEETSEASPSTISEEVLPSPLCPDGSPQTAWNPPDAILPPGLSPLDAPPIMDAPGNDDQQTGGDA